MKFYNITINVKDEKTLKEFKHANAASLSDKIFEENPKTYICMYEMRKNIATATCCIDNACNVREVADKFAGELFGETENVRICESTMSEFLDHINGANYDGFVNDDEYVVEQLGMDVFYRKRELTYVERLVSERKTKKSVFEDFDTYFLDEEYKAEIKRIFDGKTHKKIEGNPAHYFMVSSDDDARRIRVRNLVFALYQKGRICSKKYTIIDLDNARMAEWAIERLYQVNEGGVVVLRPNEECVLRSNVSHWFWSWKGVAKIIKHYATKVVTVISMDAASQKARNVILNSLDELAIVEFSDNEYKGDAAATCLRQIAKQNGVEIDESVVESVKKSERIYAKDDLKDLYEKWHNEYLVTIQFPEYARFYKKNSVSKAEQEEKSAQEKLNEMIGLEKVKKIIEGIVNYFKLQTEFKSRRIEFSRPAMHMVFTGNPGTAKTTVARLLAQILRDNNVLSRGGLVEAGRADIVGEYVGQTAPKVQQIFEKAKGSVLFIDEAYSLVDDKRGLYGDEAINTIVQEMENLRDDVVVIFAGYKKEMDEFIDRNPGLSSRIAFHVDFDDYSASELLDITKLLARERNILVDPSCDKKLLEIYESARKNASFGNGRFARNTLEKAKLNQANRLATKNITFLSDEQLETIIADDIDYVENKQTQTARLGFY